MVDVWWKTLILVTLPLLLFEGVTGAGWSLINEPCSPFKDQYTTTPTCDPYAHLACDKDLLVNEYRCKCKFLDLIWAKSVGRCTLRLGSQCYPPGPGTIPGRDPDCPPSSYCDGGSYTCKCHTDMKPLPDGSGCSTAALALLPQPPILFLLFVIATTTVFST